MTKPKQTKPQIDKQKTINQRNKQNENQKTNHSLMFVYMW